MNSQRLLCSQKAGVKCLYQSFLVYKLYFSLKKGKDLGKEEPVSFQSCAVLEFGRASTIRPRP